MPATGREAAEQRALRGRVIEVEGLRVELRGKSFDLRRVDGVRAAAEALPDMKILEVEPILRPRGGLRCHGHRPFSFADRRSTPFTIANLTARIGLRRCRRTNSPS